MTTQGIGAVFVETQNWGRAAKFFQSLGYSIDFATDHNSGLLRNGDGPYVFVVEVPADRQPQTRIALTVDDADAFQADPTLDVVTPFEETHYGTKEMVVRDPDGRLWTLQTPLKTSR